MSKEFNDTGICNLNKHYMVDTSKKIEQIIELIIKGKYFTINRPRQYGKTTIKSQIVRQLMKNEGFLPLQISFEGIESKIYEKSELFVKEFIRLFLNELEYITGNRYYGSIEKMAERVLTLGDLSVFITNFVKEVKKKVILFIDEIDKSCNNQLFLDFLAVLRNKYLDAADERDYTFYSIILIGVHDVKTLKLKIRPDEEKKYNSPWNIAADFDVDMSFFEEEIEGMLVSYKNDKNIEMDEKYFAKQIRFFTSGYPFFVSKLCKIIDEKIMKEKRWEKVYIEESIKVLLSSSNSNFDELIKNLENNEKLRMFVQDLLVGRREVGFEISVPEINLGSVYGIIDRNENGKVKIHNKIYEEKITNYLIGKIEIESMSEFSPIQSIFIKPDGRLDFRKVLLKFQEVIKEKYSNSDLLKSNEFLEKELRMMFLVFLKPIINGIGFSFKEVQTSAERRLDIVVIFRDEKFVVELKLWHGESYHKEGILQLKDYMKRESVDKGYMLIISKLKEKVFESDEQDNIFMVWV